MVAIVDPSLCIGCRLCVGTCPEVFSMDGEISVAMKHEIPEELSAPVMEAADSCPVAAIHLEGCI